LQSDDLLVLNNTRVLAARRFSDVTPSIPVLGKGRAGALEMFDLSGAEKLRLGGPRRSTT